MAVMSKPSNNVNAPSEESQSAAAAAVGQFHDHNGSMTAPNSNEAAAASAGSSKYFKVFMKGAVLIVGVAGTAWTVERAIGYTAANNNTTEALLMERHGKTSKPPKAGKTKGGKGKEEASIPAGYEFVGEGACIPESTIAPDGIPYYPSYIERDGSDYSITECATWCDAVASETCWVQNQAEAPYLGMDYGETGICYCLFQTGASPDTYVYVNPSAICTLPAGATGYAESGAGQIVATDCTATHPTYVYDCKPEYSCFKYIGQAMFLCEKRGECCEGADLDRWGGSGDVGMF